LHPAAAFGAVDVPTEQIRVFRPLAADLGSFRRRRRAAPRGAADGSRPGSRCSGGSAGWLGPQSCSTPRCCSLDDGVRSSFGVWFEDVESLPNRCLAWIRVLTSIAEAVAVRRSTTEETSFDGCLRGHRCSDPGLDAVPFAFAHASVERHDEIVCIAARIDSGDPEGDAVVHEDREGESELVAVERSLRFADDNRVEAARRVGERLEQPRRLGPPLPGKRARLANVEELLDDLAVGGFDQLPRPCELPVPR